jgi:hypothetical protein
MTDTGSLLRQALQNTASTVSNDLLTPPTAASLRQRARQHDRRRSLTLGATTASVVAGSVGLGTVFWRSGAPSTSPGTPPVTAAATSPVAMAGGDPMYLVDLLGYRLDNGERVDSEPIAGANAIATLAASIVLRYEGEPAPGELPVGGNDFFTINLQRLSPGVTITETTRELLSGEERRSIDGRLTVSSVDSVFTSTGSLQRRLVFVELEPNVQAFITMPPAWTWDDVEEIVGALQPVDAATWAAALSAAGIGPIPVHTSG